MKQLVLILAFFPLAAFCVAGLIELRSASRIVEKLRNLIPIILGIAAFALTFNPQGALLSRVMTLFSSIVACSGVFITYSRRSSAVWVAVGGLLLALFWMLNYVVV